MAHIHIGTSLVTNSEKKRKKQKGKLKLNMWTLAYGFRFFGSFIIFLRKRQRII